MSQKLQERNESCTAERNQNQENGVGHQLTNSLVKGVYSGNEISSRQKEEGRFHTGPERMKFETLASERSNLQVARHGVTQFTSRKGVSKVRSEEDRSVFAGDPGEGRTGSEGFMAWGFYGLLGIRINGVRDPPLTTAQCHRPISMTGLNF